MLNHSYFTENLRILSNRQISLQIRHKIHLKKKNHFLEQIRETKRRIWGIVKIRRLDRAENNIYSCEVCPEESLLHPRPEGEGDDQQLVGVPHVPAHN